MIKWDFWKSSKPKAEPPAMPSVKPLKTDVEGPIERATREHKEAYDAAFNREMAISEPVLSFIKCLQTNPKRFKLQAVKADTPITLHLSTEYKFKDIQTKDSWLVLVQNASYYGGEGPHITIEKSEWMTVGEREAIIKAVSIHTLNRKRIVTEHNQQILQRRNTKERNRLINIYNTNNKC